MAAPVITDGITRIPLVPGSNASVNGDRIATLPLVHRAPGQLWEREAERSIYDPETGEYSSRFSYVLSIARRTRGPVMRHTSGVIIAGQVREHRSILFGLTSIDDE